MAERATRFILDENMPVELANQLNQRGVESLTVKALDKLGEDDSPLLTYAREHGYVVCTFDSDFVEMAKQGVEHNGIVFVPSVHSDIGAMTRYLLLLHQVYNAAEMKNRVEYLFG